MLSRRDFFKGVIAFGACIAIGTGKAEDSVPESRWHHIGFDTQDKETYIYMDGSVCKKNRWGETWVKLR